MVETESFIKEVSEEVRKDNLFKTLKRYKWPIISLIGGTILLVSSYEYYKYNRKINSETNGRLLYEYIQSLENESIENVVIPSDSFLETLTKLHKAKFLEKNKKLNSAEKLYKEIIQNPNADIFFKHYSMLLLYLLSPAENLDDKSKIELLDKLSAPDAPMQLLALEQKLILFLRLEDREKIKYHVKLIADNPRVTKEQLERIQEVKELYDVD